jgi:hypothetical protein
MEETVTELSPVAESPEVESLELGILLGQNQAFALVAGRCTAAQAALLARLRDEKKYQKYSARWRDFCPKYLNISASQADYLIGMWKKYGAGFFELRQLIRISSKTYETLEPLIQEGALHFNGEAIDIDPENSQKVAAAVAELRRAMPPKPPAEPPSTDPLDDLSRRCEAILSEFDEIGGKKLQGEEGRRFGIVLNWASARLQQLEIDLGIC